MCDDCDTTIEELDPILKEAGEMANEIIDFAFNKWGDRGFLGLCMAAQETVRAANVLVAAMNNTKDKEEKKETWN